MHGMRIWIHVDLIISKPKPTGVIVQIREFYARQGFLFPRERINVESHSFRGKSKFFLSRKKQLFSYTIK